MRLLAVVIVMLVSMPVLAERERLRLVEWGYLQPYQEILQSYLVEQGHNTELLIEAQGINQAGDAFQLLRNHEADIVMGSAHFLESNNQRLLKYALPIDAHRLQNFSDLREDFVTISRQAAGGELRSMPFLAGRLMLMYRGELKLSPQDFNWGYLWQPDMQGRYLINCSDFEASVFMAQLSLGRDLDSLSELHVFRDKQAVAELEQRIVQLIRGAKSLTSYWFYSEEDLSGIDAFLTWGEGVKPEHMVGWNRWVPESNPIAVMDAIVLSPMLREKSPRQDAAYALLDFLISPSFQVRFLQDHPAPVMANRKVSGHAGLNASARNNVMDGEVEWVPALSASSTRIIKRLWQSALQASGKNIPGACLAKP